MNLVYDLIMEVLDNIQWLVLAYTLHVISKNRPTELILKAKDFVLQWRK